MFFSEETPDPVYPEIQITFIFKFRALNLRSPFKCDFNFPSCLAGMASDFHPTKITIISNLWARV